MARKKAGAARSAGTKRSGGSSSGSRQSDAASRGFTAEEVDVDSLRPHPRNYRQHPDDQLAHLRQSLREHGFYRNVVVARDGTILAGHGMIEAARAEGITRIPVFRMDVGPDDPRALKVLAGDNEMSHLAEVDDRALSELLKEVKDVDVEGLLGTGYDEAMLAALVLVTRPAGEIAGRNEAAQWAGMPEFEVPDVPFRVVVSCETKADLLDLSSRLGVALPSRRVSSTWWPPREKDDVKAVAFEEAG